MDYPLLLNIHNLLRWVVLLTALWALAQMDSHLAEPLVERALNDPDPLVREEARRFFCL